MYEYAYTEIAEPIFCDLVKVDFHMSTKGNGDAPGTDHQGKGHQGKNHQ